MYTFQYIIQIIYLQRLYIFNMPNVYLPKCFMDYSEETIFCCCFASQVSHNFTPMKINTVQYHNVSGLESLWIFRSNKSNKLDISFMTQCQSLSHYMLYNCFIPINHCVFFPLFLSNITNAFTFSRTLN